MEIQPFTYDSIKTGAWLNGTSLALPHGLGHGWAATLWDLNWDLIDKHGFNPNIYEDWDTGGNNRALQYVVDGLKMQGCGPGLVVSRAAIVSAAEALGGEDTCTVWATFARRGLGFSAVQGTTNRDDNSEAFDTHPDCRRGFLPPVTGSYGTLNEFDAGDAVPLRFTADGYRRLDVLANSGSPFSRKVDCSTLRVPSSGQFITPRELPISTQTAGGAKLTVSASGVFTYPWKTLEEWAGTCREVVVTRDDGKQHRAFFRFL
jgi:extracellular elastinolytic metalloproteinase